MEVVVNKSEREEGEGAGRGVLPVCAGVAEGGPGVSFAGEEEGEDLGRLRVCVSLM